MTASVAADVEDQRVRVGDEAHGVVRHIAENLRRRKSDQANIADVSLEAFNPLESGVIGPRRHGLPRWSQIANEKYVLVVRQGPKVGGEASNEFIPIDEIVISLRREGLFERCGCAVALARINICRPKTRGDLAHRPANREAIRL
ncbi:hypothetical protein [Methylosinus sp. 3S-1]|uniref:hypothetical protein n=1 Tax=Methylosinus sp. 3S-1 TaxID=1849840 RepID=UPI0018D37547|nr:hypothetical protein [Methylosinus sp. 3S-1]